MSLGWALFSIFPSYLMLHYCFLGNRGLRLACHMSKFLMMLTGLGQSLSRAELAWHMTVRTSLSLQMN